MFQMKNGRFYADTDQQRLSLAVPEGLWLDTNPGSVCEYGLSFYSSDRSVEVTFMVSYVDPIPLSEEIQKILNTDDDLYRVEASSTIKVGNMDGTCLIFVGCGKYSSHHDCEIKVDIADYGLHTREGLLCDEIVIRAFTNENENFRDYIESPEFQGFLAGFKME